MSRTIEISNSDDLIDTRDIIARTKELEDARGDTAANEAEAEELERLTAFLGDLAGTGGDEQFRGDWYPVTLIRDSYFKTYAMELADGIGAVNSDATWPNNCIDWDKAARELRMDYTAVDFDGVTYWVR